MSTRRWAVVTCIHGRTVWGFAVSFETAVQTRFYYCRKKAYPCEEGVRRALPVWDDEIQVSYGSIVFTSGITDMYPFDPHMAYFDRDTASEPRPMPGGDLVWDTSPRQVEYSASGMHGDVPCYESFDGQLVYRSENRWYCGHQDAPSWWCEATDGDGDDWCNPSNRPPDNATWYACATDAETTHTTHFVNVAPTPDMERVAVRNGSGWVFGTRVVGTTKIYLVTYETASGECVPRWDRPHYVENRHRTCVLDKDRILTWDSDTSYT